MMRLQPSKILQSSPPMQQNQSDSPPGKSWSLTKVQNLFFLNGITSLLGWNAVLGSLDYFQSCYPTHNIYLYFPVPVFIAYVITAVGFNWINSQFDYKTLVKVGIAGTNISLALLVLVSNVAKGSGAGYWICLIICFFIGFFNNFAQLSFFGMINYFGSQTVSRYTIGTAASGLMLIVLRAIITASFTGSSSTGIAPILIYFILSIVFNFFDLALNLKLFASSEYKNKIQCPVAPSIIEEVEAEQSLISNSANNNIEDQGSYFRLLYESFLATFPFPAFIFFNFVITFMLFPNLTLAVKTSLSDTWNNITLLMMYNIGDLAGKIIGDFRGSFNSKSILFLFFSRLFFFYTIPLMTESFTQNDHVLNNNFFPFFNQILFALTNGLVINGSFILMFQKAPDRYKKYAGVLGGILIQFGIMLGTLLAIPTQMIVNPQVASVKSTNSHTASTNLRHLRIE